MDNEDVREISGRLMALEDYASQIRQLNAGTFIIASSAAGIGMGWITYGDFLSASYSASESLVAGVVAYAAIKSLAFYLFWPRSR